MTKEPISVTDSTSLTEAIRIMEDNHLLNLPVERNGKVAYTLTRHDILHLSYLFPG